MTLQPHERQLIGKWEFINGRMIADATCDRVEALVKEYLVRVAVDDSGWDTLFQDPSDGRYWERVYLQGHMHGGGPPSLILIEPEAAKRKYKF